MSTDFDNKLTELDKDWLLLLPGADWEYFHKQSAFPKRDDLFELKPDVERSCGKIRLTALGVETKARLDLNSN